LPYIIAIPVNASVRLFFATALSIIPLFSATAALNKLGAMGESYTDEFNLEAGLFMSNWVSQLSTFRGIDFGPTAAQAGVGTWGEPRRLGYKYNWARSGATSSTLLTQGQHTGCAGQFASNGVSSAVLAIGLNDFIFTSAAYHAIYSNTWSALQIQTYVSQTVSNIETALVTVRNAGVSVALANIIDSGLLPGAAGFTNASARDQVTVVIQTANSRLKDLAQKYQVPLVDWYGLMTTILGPNTNPHATLKVGNVTMNLRGIDSGSTHTNAFIDGAHPNTVIQGLFANLFLQSFVSGYGATNALFSEQEILSHAGIAYGGSDTLQSQIGAYSDYIFLPAPPKFTSITVAGTNVTLNFSTASNQLYLVERSDDLNVGLWATLATNFPGNGGITALTTNVPFGSPKGFYRVRQLP
jgi:lysophospholipase L1-like esterase